MCVMRKKGLDVEAVLYANVSNIKEMIVRVKVFLYN